MVAVSGFVRMILITTALLSTSLCHASPHGAEAYKGKDPIGGGSGYTRIVSRSKAKYVVSTLEELRAALRKAKAGEVVYVSDGAEIDATNAETLVIPGGVTLAGNRGDGKSLGPVLKTKTLKACLLLANAPNVRVTGLRIRGPHAEIPKGNAVLPSSDGIKGRSTGLEVDNCEIWGWTHAGVWLTEASTGTRVHHCYIHHCRREGLGYGICLSRSEAYIEANRFADNRHDIAGTGREGTSYTACYNISEANDAPMGHAFDMHGNHESRKPGEVAARFAGDSVVIFSNTFRSCRPRNYIVIRGEPREKMVVRGNLYENAATGAEFRRPCANAVISGDFFKKPPVEAYYSFATAGNTVNGVRMPAGKAKTIPGEPEAGCTAYPRLIIFARVCSGG